MPTFIYCNVKLYMFRASQRPSSGVPKTVSATSGIAQHVSGVLTHIIRGSTIAVAASGFNVVVWW
jgi:hypothetical protein